MKLWISKNGEISIRDQIVTQVRLGIATCDLKPGEKLPSTRELARRFGIHPNTVSAAYRELAAASVVEFRHGSGVFITKTNEEDVSISKNVDSLVSDLAAIALAHGFTRAEIKDAFDRWNSRTDGKTLTIVESDLGLRSVISEEISARLGIDAECITLDDFLVGNYDQSSVLTALNDEKEKMEPVLDHGQTAIFLTANSPTHTLASSDRPDKANLIAVVSGWQQFLAFARMYLIAAKIDPDVLIIRSTSEPNWPSGLEAASIIICDSAAAKHFPNDDRLRVFRLIADDSLAALKQAIA